MSNKLSIVARQPIVDQNKELFAYELLYRESDTNAFQSSDGQRVTMRLLSEQFLTFQKKNLDSKQGFVNFEYKDLIEGVPFDFSSKDIVVEILESCSPTDELFNAVADLKQKHYLVALDDFEPSSEWDRFYKLIDFIKLDLRALSMKECAGIINDFRHTDIQFVAEKIENNDEFQQACQCGFDFFQGYFYQKPELIKTKKLSASAVDIFKLSALVAKREIEIHKVNQVIERNPALSLQLLKFVNNDSRLSKPIESTQQALAYLGNDRIRKYVTYTTLSSLSPDKPSIILKNLLVRAKLLEELAVCIKQPLLAESAYLCGMLSLVEGLLDMRLVDIISSLPLSEMIVDGLIDRKGGLGSLLSLAEAIESSNWRLLDSLLKEFNLPEQTVMTCITNSNAWVSEL